MANAASFVARTSSTPTALGSSPSIARNIRLPKPRRRIDGLVAICVICVSPPTHTQNPTAPTTRASDSNRSPGAGTATKTLDVDVLLSKLCRTSASMDDADQSTPDTSHARVYEQTEQQQTRSVLCANERRRRTEHPTARTRTRIVVYPRTIPSKSLSRAARIAHESTLAHAFDNASASSTDALALAAHRRVDAPHRERRRRVDDDVVVAAAAAVVFTAYPTAFGIIRTSRASLNEDD